MQDVIIEDLDEDLYKKKEDNMKKKKSKIKKLNIFLFLISLIWIVLIILNTYLVFKYDVLPFKYLIIYIILIILIPLILIIFSMKKKVKKGIKVFVIIIGIISIILLNFAFYYMNKTFNFLDHFTSNYNYETKNYVVLVLKDSEYEKIRDLKHKKFGYVKQNVNTIDKALTEIENEIVFKEEEYKDYTVMLLSLDNKEIDAVLLEESYYQMFDEEDENFDLKYKLIYEFSLTEKVEEIKKDVDVSRDTFNIYISGIDSYGNVSSLTRSDVNIVVSINPKSNQILMINIPRDYYILFPGTNQKDKLTHAGIYGLDMSVKSIENLLDMEINYYFKVNYGALVNLVDALGGVDVYSKYTFTSGELYYKYQKGYNHVNGKQALEFVRTRKAFKDGDRVRGENQQAMIEAIIKKSVSSAILKSYSNILDSLKGSFTTNMGTDKITDIVKMQLDEMPSWNITSISLNGSDSYDYTYTYPYQKLYVMVPDEDTILEASEKLTMVKDGKMLDSSYQENTGIVNNPTVNKPVVEDTKKMNLQILLVILL